GSEFLELQTTEISATSRAYGQGARLDLPFAGDQEVRHTLECMLPDFKANLLIPQVRFYPKPLIFQVFRNFQAILVLRIGNSDDHGLNRSQPSRQFTRVMLEQNA